MTVMARQPDREVGGMSYRTAAWLAWSLCVLELTALGLWFLNLNLDHPGTSPGSTTRSARSATRRSVRWSPRVARRTS